MIILALHAGMVSPITAELVLITERLKQSAGARRCQSQRRPRGNHRYMQGHNKDY